MTNKVQFLIQNHTRTSNIFEITRAQYRKYDSNNMSLTECTLLFDSSAMFPLIFCSLYAQKFWCAQIFLDMSNICATTHEEISVFEPDSQ